MWEHTRELNTDLQLLGLGTDLKYWLSNIVMGFKNYWIWQLVFDGVGLYEANHSGSKHQSSVYVIQVILAKETIWLKPMLPNY